MRGGKRLRAAVLLAGFRAVAPHGLPGEIIDAAAAVELLQSYLLIHDDWMDRDDLRRGGPSVHARLRRLTADEHLGDSLAILAGDLAAGWGWELMSRARFPEHRFREALAVYGAIHQEVIAGQYLDLTGRGEIERVYSLKSGAYTVRGPLLLGALLGDARPKALAELDRFGEPLGAAFQLRDDLLGLFGKDQALGKPRGSDLRAGKNTLIAAEAKRSLDPTALPAFERVFGNRGADDAQVAEVVALLESSGVRERIDAQLAELLDRSRQALQQFSLGEPGRSMLEELVGLLGVRDH